MVRLAENERRKREAEESGKRQAEQVLRDRQDVLYGELMKVHQGSVDSYLQSVIMKTMATLQLCSHMPCTKTGLGPKLAEGTGGGVRENWYR